MVTACEPSAIPRAAVPCERGVSGPTQPAVGGNVLVAWELSERQGHPAILMPAGTRLQARLAGLFLVDSTPRAVAT